MDNLKNEKNVFNNIINKKINEKYMKYKYGKNYLNNNLNNNENDDTEFEISYITDCGGYSRNTPNFINNITTKEKL